MQQAGLSEQMGEPMPDVQGDPVGNTLNPTQQLISFIPPLVQAFTAQIFGFGIILLGFLGLHRATLSNNKAVRDSLKTKRSAYLNGKLFQTQL